MNRRHCLASLVLVIGASLSSCALPVSQEDPRTVVDALTREESRAPELPILAPKSVPVGWKFDSISGMTTKGKRATHELMFSSEKLSSPPVTLCVQRATDEAEHCRGSKHDGPFVTKVDGLVGVWVFTAGDRVGPEAWAGIQLTRQWHDLAWVTR